MDASKAIARCEAWMGKKKRTLVEQSNEGKLPVLNADVRLSERTKTTKGISSKCKLLHVVD